MIAIVPISALSGDIPCDGDPALEDRFTLLLSSFVPAAQRLSHRYGLEVTPVVYQPLDKLQRFHKATK
jgi:hypothetical protein